MGWFDAICWCVFAYLMYVWFIEDLLSHLT